MDIVAVSPAEKLAHRHAGDLAEDVPTRDVDSTFHIGMAFQRRVHRSVELRQLARIFADDMRAELAKSGAYALGVCRQVEWTERADFAVSNEPGVRLDAHDGAVEDLNRLAATPRVRGLVQRKL